VAQASACVTNRAAFGTSGSGEAYPLTTAMLKDIVYALRTFRQNPGFVAVVVLSIALAIAANTTVFSIANGLLFGELPVNEPQRLVSFNSGRSMS
jgi:hypothetical protein